MNISNSLKSLRSQRGSTILTVMILCAGLIIVATALFSSLMTNRRMIHKAELLSQASEGAEGVLGLATAELNRRATSYAAMNTNPLSGWTIPTATLAKLAGTGTSNNLDSTSVELKLGSLSAGITNMTLDGNDPVFRGDTDVIDTTQAVRSGDIFARVSAIDPLTGGLTTAYLAGTVQLREKSWLNYGFFYNMDMEFNPGPRMDIYGAVHSNADIYLASDGDNPAANPNTSLTAASLNFYKKLTASGHIYRGLKYCIKAYNTDASGVKTASAFEAKASWSEGGIAGKGKDSVWCTNGTALVKMAYNNDCLGTATNVNNTTQKAYWLGQETNTWNKNVMDKLPPFTPPGLPLYVPEDYSTSATELRNYGYAMIEPQLPSTDSADGRYYGRKSDAVENLKFSAQAGLTIVVEDLDRSVAQGVTGAVSLATAAQNGYAIPWKLVWYQGSSLPGQPLNQNNLPSRTSGLADVLGSLDPFAKNDEVDKAADPTNAAIVVTMRRNLKALLRDAIVVVPYHDNGGGSYGAGSITATITSYPATYTGPAIGTTLSHHVNHYAFDATDAGLRVDPAYRYIQPAGAWPGIMVGTTTIDYTLNTDTTTDKTYNAIYYGNTAVPAAATYGGNRYPDSSTALAGSPGVLNKAAGIYSGLYDRRQGFDGSTSTTSGSHNSGLKGAMCVVYIDLQKLNWILNQTLDKSDLWKRPDGTVIYDVDKSYTNLIYVDLPSAPRDATRFALTDSDQVCPAVSPTATKPGYCVLLRKGARLPRVTYNTGLRTPGFTLATNGPLYIQGNFNADGRQSTGNSQLPDSDAQAATISNQANWYSAANPNAEVPAMVAADAVTFLSSGFSTITSAQPNGGAITGTYADGTAVREYDGYNNDTTATTASFQEISTAVITGLTATIPDLVPTIGAGKCKYSGGANNLPRFIEDFGSFTVRYRGSMAALFESEVADGYMIQGSHPYWFAPPNRDWGYNAYFAAGQYPPGTPVIRTARLMNMRKLNAAEYATGPAQPP